MRVLDETTISSYRTPGLLLMDRAGTAAAHAILSRFAGVQGPTIVVCGKGNNGGDGFVIARVLAEHGRDVTAILTAPVSQLSGDAAAQFSILKAHRIAPIRPASALPRPGSRPVGLVIDALFGTGFKGTPRGTPGRAIAWMNTCGAPVAAVDIPSGIDATTGVAEGAYVKADLTITFGLMKTGLLLNDGRGASGHVVCVDIGLPRKITHDAPADVYLVERSDVAAALPLRPLNLHKYSAGKVLVFAGSRGFTGAAALASRSAMLSGAGAVMLMTPGSVYGILARKLSGEIVVPVADAADGTFGPMSIAPALEKLAWADVVLIGPGISRTPGTHEFFASVLSAWKGPAVIDADGISILAASVRLQRMMRDRDWTLTPHTGEFSALCGEESQSIEHGRIGIARAFARKHRATLILKGAPTCTAAAEGTCYINATGNPGMATVGSGDVLAGLVAGLRAQGMDSLRSAWCGAYLHGLAGDHARDSAGERSVLATDILENIPSALRECERVARA